MADATVLGVHDALTLQGRDASRLRTARFVALPLGSVEYHGPHGPLGTDVTLAVGFARGLAEEADGVLLPAIPYAFTPIVTRSRPGTIHVPAEAYLPYLRAVLASVLAAGATRVVVVNGHSENGPSLRLAAETAAGDVAGASFLLVDWWRLVEPGAGAEAGFGERDGHGHGGPLELSVTASFEPSGVAPGGAPDVPYEAPWWRGAAQVVGAGGAPVGFDGYHGRVSEISSEAGARVADGVRRRLRRLVDDWLVRAAG